MRVGLIGYGAIGRQIADRIVRGDVAGVSLTGVATRHPRGPHKRVDGSIPSRSIADCARYADVLVEAASPEAVPQIVAAAERHGTSLILLSGCALIVDPEVQRRIEMAGIRCVLPSAAVAGLDGIAAAAQGTIDRAMLTIRRPCHGIEDAPYVCDQGIDLSEWSEERLLFEGSPREACLGFPGRTNIAASVALSGAGPERTHVRIYAGPARAAHRHEIRVEAPFGVVESAVTFDAEPPEGVASIMSLSVLAALHDLVSHVRHRS